MRRPLLGLLLALAACGSPRPRPQPAPAPQPPASASAGPWFDASRLDAPVLTRLTRYTDPGPLEGALDQASRDDLSTTLGKLGPAEREALRRQDPGVHPSAALLVVATDPEALGALHALCCGGRAWPSLRALRPRKSPPDDLPAQVRSLTRWAAQATARRMGSPGRPPLNVAEAELVADAALVLGDAGLLQASRELAAALEPTPARKLAASEAASAAIDPAAARAQLDAARAAEPASLPPGALASAEEALALAERLQRAGAEARGAQALDAAEAAARLGRDELAATLLGRSGVDPARDLRAAAVAASARLGGGVCLGFERSREPPDLCPLAFRTSPDGPPLIAQLEAAFASGKGRSPWAQEVYLGFAHVLPMTFAVSGGQARTLEQARSAIDTHLTAIDQGLEGLPSPRREALGLFVDVLRQATERAFSPGAAAPPRPLLGRALALVEAQPPAPLSQQAALGALLVLPRTPDAARLLRKLPPAGPSAEARAAAAALLGQLWRAQDLTEQGLASLDQPGPWTPPELRARGRLLAHEVRLLQSATPAQLEALLALLKNTAEGSLEPADQLHRGIDRVGALARLGRRAEAEEAFAQQAQRLSAPGADPSLLDLTSLFEAVGEALLLTAPEPEARRRGAERLRQRLDRPREPLSSSAVRLYRALWLRGRLAESCAPRDAACKDALPALKKRLDREISELQREVPDDARALLAQGFALVGSDARLSLGFGVPSGLSITLGFTPRLVLVPAPP